MTNATKMAHMAVEDMSTAEVETFLKWLQKQVPVKVEAETPALDSAAKWWLAKLESGNVLPGIGWPKELLVDDLGSDYINVLKRKITRVGNKTAMGKFLEKVGAVEKKRPSRKIRVTIRAGEPGGEGLRPGAEVTRTRRGRYYIFHELGACRAAFEAKYGKQDWADSDDSGDSADDAQKGDSQCPDGE